ncbi:MAG: hypothetical protein U0168_11945 [Nannocystaceae bacterium]
MIALAIARVGLAGNTGLERVVDTIAPHPATTVQARSIEIDVHELPVERTRGSQHRTGREHDAAHGLRQCLGRGTAGDRDRPRGGNQRQIVDVDVHRDPLGRALAQHPRTDRIAAAIRVEHADLDQGAAAARIIDGPAGVLQVEVARADDLRVQRVARVEIDVEPQELVALAHRRGAVGHDRTGIAVVPTPPR